MPLLPTAPLWLTVPSPVLSAVGQGVGQRCCRVHQSGSKIRFMMAMAVISSVQMFVALSIVQLALPEVTTHIFEKVNVSSSLPNNNSNTTITKQQLINVCAPSTVWISDGSAKNVSCYSQGPLTMYRGIGECPKLLLIGVLNIVYYYAEAALFRHSVGVLILMLARLSSALLIVPLNLLVDATTSNSSSSSSSSSSLPVGAVVMGVIGSILCTVERRRRRNQLQEDNKNDDEREVSQSFSSRLAALCRNNILPVLVPFSLYSLSNALYYILMLFLNRSHGCSVNMWMFNSVDQVLLPVYLLPAIFIVVELRIFFHKKVMMEENASSAQQHDVHFTDLCVQTFRDLFQQHDQQRFRDEDDDDDDDDDDDGNREQASLLLQAGVNDDAAVTTDNNTNNIAPSDEHLSSSSSSTTSWAGFWTFFLYRFILNGSAVLTSYIALDYDLESSYLQITLMKVALSWVVSGVLVVVVPRYIGASAKERATFADPLNIFLKVGGSGLVVGAMLMLHEKDSK